MLVAGTVLSALPMRLLLASTAAGTVFARMHLGDHGLVEALGSVAMDVTVGCLAIPPLLAHRERLM